MPNPNTGVNGTAPGAPLWRFDNAGNLILAGQLAQNGVLAPDGSLTAAPNGPFSPIGSGITDWLNVKSPTFGAKGNGTTDDTAAIQAALSAARPGQVVYLPSAVYLISAPLILPPWVTMLGNGGSLNSSATSDNRSTLVVSASFSQGNAAASCVVLMVSQSVGDYATSSAGQQIIGLTIDGSSAPSGVYGIGQYGGASDNVGGVRIAEVQLRALTADGFNNWLNTSGQGGDGWHLSHVLITSCGGNGITLGSFDHNLIDVHSIGNTGDAFFLTNGTGNNQFVGCRAEWSTYGWHLSSFTDNVFADCTTDRNTKHGVFIDGTNSGSNPLLSFSSCRFRRDGRNGGTGGGNYAGFCINPASNGGAVVTMAACQIEPGVDDNGSGTNSPQYGIYVNNQNKPMVVSSCFVQGATTAVGFGGGGAAGSTFVKYSNTVFATGTQGSPTYQFWNLSGGYGGVGGPGGTPTAEQHAAVAWTFDPILAGSQLQVSNGVVYLASLYVDRMATISAIHWAITTAGVAPTSNENFVGLYDSGGNLLTSANVDSVVTSAAKQTTTVSSATLTPGHYYVAWVFNAGTAPKLACAPNIAWTFTNLPNAGLTGSAGALRFATNGSGVTAMPSPTITLANNVAVNVGFWAMIS